jgi:hypothetical protein
MTRKKTGFFSFLCSLIPGAGEMYMGFYKQGLSLMVIFFGVIAISSYIDIGPLLLILPVMWFYSFFHVNNLKSMPDEEFYEVEDDYIFRFDDENLKGIMSGDKGRKILAFILIFLGASAIWNGIRHSIFRIFLTFDTQVADIFDDVARGLPRTVIAIIVIYIGIQMIRGKKRELNHKNDTIIDVEPEDMREV